MAFLRNLFTFLSALTQFHLYSKITVSKGGVQCVAAVSLWGCTMNIEIRDFNIKLNKENIMRTLGCFEGSSVYDSVSAYFDEIEQKLPQIISPLAIIEFEDDLAYCILTIGEKISEYSAEMFDLGEGMKALLIDAMADEYLFSMDNIVAERIKLECAKKGCGIKKRLDAPEDFPLSEQRVIIEKTGIENISLTSAFMFNPTKTFGYILELTSDKSVFNAQHDCSKCRLTDCPRRSVSKNENFSVLSGYAYTPSLKSGDSAVCIDIGTTTVVFQLITSKGVQKTYKTINPQRRFGIDVLSRIEASNRGRKNDLASVIRYTLISGYKEITREYGDAEKVIIAGNTTMIHLLMGYSCVTLGEYPFKSEHLNTHRTTFDHVTNSKVSPVETIILGGISAFVGGDITSGLYMCDFDKSEKVNLFIDLGTNGEMAVGSKDKIIVTSTAAGPAFEGGKISCGTGSVDGAICSVDLKSDITKKSAEIKTINNKPPAGICGTGIIELVSELLDAKIIDKTGLLCDKYFDSGYSIAENISFTQGDIRQLQMAKSAVHAGVEILVREYGVNLTDIDTVYLAGGFGYGLSIEKACNIGILPKEFMGKTKAIGNSSLGGCAKCCSDTGYEARIEHIKNISMEMSLANCSDFEKLYIEYMNF